MFTIYRGGWAEIRNASYIVDVLAVECLLHVVEVWEVLREEWVLRHKGLDFIGCKLCEVGPTEAIFEAPQEDYTRRLIAASIKG